jgi:hypothetical protein
MRTTREPVTFAHPFVLDGAEGVQPAGTYDVEVDEELIEGLSFLAYRRVATTIYLPLASGATGSHQAVRVDPRELESAHRDASDEAPAGSWNAPYPLQTTAKTAEERA